ncbi:MAG: sensor histidine kinase [Proteobacteria bacterium]|nr:sensor histidine kinase [Pseudomonadota bacterium]
MYEFSYITIEKTLIMETTQYEDIEHWIHQLENLATGTAICPDFLRPFHLVTLALFIKKLGWTELCLPEELSAYAGSMGLFDVIDMAPPSNMKKSSARSGSCELRPFIPETQQQKEYYIDDIASNLTTMMYPHMPSYHQNIESLKICLTEIIGNSFDHAEQKNGLPGLACAQRWPKGNLAQIAVVDSGIGIRKSLHLNEDLHTSLNSMNSCELASQYGITSKPNAGHSGYGLALIKDLMQQNSGTYILLSGNELYYASGNDQMQSYLLDISWKGTLLIFEWRIDQHLDVGAVYNNWPHPEGYDETDFNF